MSTLAKLRFTPEEYLALEWSADYKSQYVAGEIFAMAGAQPWHVRITGNIGAMLHSRFQGRPCEYYASDMRVKVAAAEMYTYPDVVALCGKPIFETRPNPQSLLNPQVIFEVLSPSTEVFDRGEKFARYRKLDSLTDYILVGSERMRVEHHSRQTSGVWTCAEHEHPSTRLTLASINCDMPLAEIYNRVNFPGYPAFEWTA